MQFTQTRVEFEAGMDRGQDLRVDGQRRDSVVAIEQAKPRDEGLADFALLVVDRDVLGARHRGLSTWHSSGGLCAGNDR